MAANECIPLFEPGAAVTCKATAAVTGKRFIDISGDPDNVNFPGLESDAGGTGQNRLKVAHATAAGKAFGVASYDAAIGAELYAVRGHGMIAPVTADGAVTAGDLIMVGAAGKAKTGASTFVTVGEAVNTAADGEDVFVALK